MKKLLELCLKWRLLVFAFAVILCMTLLQKRVARAGG